MLRDQIQGTAVPTQHKGEQNAVDQCFAQDNPQVEQTVHEDRVGHRQPKPQGRQRSHIAVAKLAEAVGKQHVRYQGNPAGRPNPPANQGQLPPHHGTHRLLASCPQDEMDRCSQVAEDVQKVDWEQHPILRDGRTVYRNRFPRIYQGGEHGQGGQQSRFPQKEQGGGKGEGTLRDLLHEAQCEEGGAGNRREVHAPQVQLHEGAGGTHFEQEGELPDQQGQDEQKEDAAQTVPCVCAPVRFARR